jgi:hypothetical protein
MGKVNVTVQLPYLVVYRVQGNAVEILRVFTRQRIGRH